MVEQLTLGIIIAAALADSINPCVFGVLIFLLAYMVTVFKNKLKKKDEELAFFYEQHLPNLKRL